MEKGVPLYSVCYTFPHMFNPLSWIQRNKLSAALIGLVLVIFFSQFRNRPYGVSQSLQFDEGMSGGIDTVMMEKSSLSMPSSAQGGARFQEAAPAPDVTNRMVVTNSYLSLVVEDVNAGVAEVKQYIQSIGGYLVNSSISRPEEGGTGTITVRIPSDQLDETLAQLKNQAVKVVSENLDGTDVTDQFVDNEARLVILERNKARFEEIMTLATEVNEILRVQSEIFGLQSQIDSIKGQQNYLTQTAKMSLVTLYLSTDELSLPYAPANVWRPAVVFKLAVRSLMGSAQGLGTLLIWLTVYSVVWLPILLIILYIARKRRKVSQPMS